MSIGEAAVLDIKQKIDKSIPEFQSQSLMTPSQPVSQSQTPSQPVSQSQSLMTPSQPQVTTFEVSWGSH